MAKAMKITDRTFLVFRQELDTDHTYRKDQVIGRYVVVLDPGNWFLMFEVQFENTFKFIDRESPNTFSDVEVKTS